MALTPNVIYGALFSARSAGAHAFLGVNFERLALGISMGITQWGVGQSSNLALKGLAAGISGAGSINPVSTKITVIPAIPLYLSAFSGANLNGPLATSLASVMATGISQAFGSSAQYVGPVPGVGAGADVSKVVTANAATLATTLNSTLRGTLGSGQALPLMVKGLSDGITQHLLTGIGAGSVVGSTTVPPAPSSATTNSSVI